ncbi:MAG: hypothetical protein HQK64_04380 [Desulfamplus sp.]|nr:hypothetical protein [Desulfamplus sp.]MBF0388573.1 hypothetical protein [Desulfamplus sp.]
MAIMVTAGKYSAATFEYAGRVSISYLKRSGCAISCGFKKIATPVANVAAKPFVYFKDRRAKSLQEKQLKAINRHVKEHAKLLREMVLEDSIVTNTALNNHKISLLEDKIAQIEKQLLELEKNGVRLASSPINSGGQKEIFKQQNVLTSQKSALLQAIVDENRALRES